MGLNELNTLLEGRIQQSHRERRRTRVIAVVLAVLLVTGGGAAVSRIRQGRQSPAQQPTEVLPPQQENGSAENSVQTGAEGQPELSGAVQTEEKQDSSPTAQQTAEEEPSEEGSAAGEKTSPENGGQETAPEAAPSDSEDKADGDESSPQQDNTHHLRLDGVQGNTEQVKLYVTHDGEDVATLVLNEENRWQASWESDLPVDSLEFRLESGAGGRAILSGGDVYIVLDPEAEDAGQITVENLPQTGQSWTGCLGMSVLGLGLCVIGAEMKRRKESM